MRISGLATGMDTETIIRDMMKAHRLPLTKVTQKKQYLEWQLDDYRTINRKLWDYRNNISDTVMREANYLAKTVSVSDEKAVSIRALNAESDFSGTIEIHKLATNARLQSGSALGSNVSAKTTLSELGLTGEQKIKITAPGSTEAKELTFSETATVEQVIRKMNSSSDVNAFFDEHTGNIVLTAKNSGTGSITIEDTTGGLANTLNLSGGISTAGSNAVVTINGLRTTRESNTFRVNGFEFNLKQVTAPLTDETDENSAVAANGQSVSFSSTTDTDKIFDSIVKFVNDYNEMIADLNAKIREPKYRSFHPLSTEEKDDMKEKEIELWEEKAKSGTLRNDATISSMLSKMRQAASQYIELEDGTKISLREFGIKPSVNYLDHGKLEIDENKLREAIAENPNHLYQLMSGDGKDTGVARGIVNAADQAHSVIKEKAGSVGSGNDTFTLGRSLKDMNNQITRFEDRMKMIEDRYWKQFTAMEKAIQRANAQAAQMMNMFGGGQM